MKKVLVTGDRDWINSEIIRKYLQKLKSEGFGILIQGECKGADTIARIEAEKLGFVILNRDDKTRGFPAQWDIYHKAAGPIRNQEMLDVGKPDLILAFHPEISKSKGTRDMILKGRKAGVPTTLINGKGEVCEEKTML